jgi:hypothetical protein
MTPSVRRCLASLAPMAALALPFGQTAAAAPCADRSDACRGFGLGAALTRAYQRQDGSGAY